MKQTNSKFRKFVSSMKSYVPIAPPSELAKELGLKIEDIIKLDANENPFGFPDVAKKALENCDFFSIYPDPAQRKLKEEIALYAGCECDQVIAGTGADELIDLVMRLFINPGDKVLNFAPTFSYYNHLITLNQAELVNINRDEEFSLDFQKIEKIDFDSIKLVILCSPNNPSGGLISENELKFFLNKGCITLLDEAYFEFSGKSYLELIEQYPNLIILRTFSKCFGLAGLRAGYSISHKNVAEAIMKIKPPYSVNTAAEEALIACLKEKEFFQNQVKQIIENRDYLIKELESLKAIKVFPSSSNFVLCKIKEQSAEEIFRKLRQKGIMIRYFKTDLLDNYVRISVGTKKQLDIFLREFKKILKDNKKTSR